AAVSNRAPRKQNLRAAAGIDPAGCRFHDLRRTAATGMQRLGTRIEVIEQAINHASGTRAGIVGTYQRHDYLDEVRIALQKWANRIEEIAGGEPAKVVKLR